jgi:hypothetical protein
MKEVKVFGTITFARGLSITDPSSRGKKSLFAHQGMHSSLHKEGENE